MSPISIEILLKCYYSPEPLEHLEWPAHREVVEDFISDGLIVATVDINRFAITEMGRAHVEQLCNLPYPMSVWVGGDGKPIYPKEKT
jgi:hypothetical protein